MARYLISDVNLDELTMFYNKFLIAQTTLLLKVPVSTSVV